jgi:hypothetical protein
MSTLAVNELRGTPENNWAIAMPQGTYITSPGQVIQTVWRRFDYPTTYYNLPISGNPTEIKELNVRVAKKFSNSYCYIQWWLFYETHHNVTFKCMRDNAVIGYNTEVGNTRYSGIGTAEYEHSFDYNSTPSVMHLAYWDQVNTSAEINYQLGAMGSGGGVYQIAFNVPINMAATDSYERGVSWCMVQEIMPG